MVICKFFQQGNCRNGNNCTFEHVTPGGGRGRGGFGGNQNSNRGAPNTGPNFNSGRGGFSGFGNNHNRGNFQGGRGGFHHGSQTGHQRNSEKIFVDPKIIEADLTTDRPIWPLSCYSPRIDTARQLLEGEIELSPEEMRYRSYLLVAQGQNSQIAELEAKAFGLMQDKVRNVLSNLKDAAIFAATGHDQHPNRLDIANGAPAQSKIQGASSFGQPAGQQSSNPANPFGAPSGAPSAGRANPFGQPSALGQASPFAQATTQPRPGGFGQPSGLGGASPFATTGNQTQGAFGQTSSLGQGSPFNQAGQHKPNPFGAPSGPFNQANNPSPFAPQPNPNPSPFAQASQPQQANPFGQPSQPAQATSNFSSQTTIVNGHSGNSTNPFANNQTSNGPFSNASQQANIQASPFAQAQRQSSGINRHIFPQGIPTHPLVDNPPTEMYAVNEAAYQSAYQHVKQNGSFEANLVPMLPPKADWISYDDI